MTLADWVIDLLEEIKEAAYKGENFDLHMENELLKEIKIITESYEDTSWIEIVGGSNV